MRIYILLLLFLPCLLYSEKKDILIIESYHADFYWDISYKKGIEETVGKDYNYHYFEMNTKRLPKSEFEKMAKLAWEKYLKLKPSVVVLGDDNALKYLGKKFSKTSTPVVYLGINNNPRVYDMVRHKNITGVLERPLLKRSILYIKDIIKIKKILVLFDTGTSSSAIAKDIFNNKSSISLNDVEIDIKFIDDYSIWQKTILESKKNNYDVLIIGSCNIIKDDKQNYVDLEELIIWTSKNTPIPPFSFWEFSVASNKTIGGYVLFGEEQGKAAGAIILDILSGKSPGEIQAKIPEKGKFLFSKFQLKKWKIKLTKRIKDKASFYK